MILKVTPGGPEHLTVCTSDGVAVLPEIINTIVNKGFFGGNGLTFWEELGCLGCRRLEQELEPFVRDHSELSAEKIFQLAGLRGDLRFEPPNISERTPNGFTVGCSLINPLNVDRALRGNQPPCQREITIDLS